jgi:predicted RecB family nuclease
MQLSASDFYVYYSPHRCGRRAYLRHIGTPEEPASPYEEVLRRLGERHEREHLSTLIGAVDLSGGSKEDRRRRTREEVEKRTAAIYQPAFEASVDLGGEKCQVVGEPDFLVWTGSGYVIRDSKMSRRITEKDHPEIILQLGTYGLLFETTFGATPAGLQVHSGSGEIVDVSCDPNRVVGELDILRNVNRLSAEPFGAVGWSKCGSCPFRPHCWDEAEAKKAVALVYGVDEGLAFALHEQDIDTVAQLLDTFDEDTLASFQRPWGTRMQRVGKKSTGIMLMARALHTGMQSVLQTPQVPSCPNYVMFDLEGMPPQLQELDKVYLWGMQVFGEKPGSYMPAVAGFGPDGERQGWESFLQKASAIFDAYGEIRFVHWADYEATHLKACMTRYGDRDGIGARVLRNLLNLLPITRDSIALPLPSYSLKVIEKYIGFKRTQEEYGGDWSMAKFIEATETEDEKQRAEVMNQILLYNKEDLGATWAVLTWLRQVRLN